MNSSKLSQTTDISPNTDRTGGLDRRVGATWPIMKAISRRRSHRHQWRIFECIAILLLDATLIDASFRLAHFMRYNVLFRNSLLTFFRNNIENNNPTKDIYASLSSFTGLEIGVVVGLVVIFAFRGLYNIRLTGSWFRQAWTIASSATVGLAFLVTYFFVFQPPSSSRLLVPFIWIMAIVVLSSGRLIVSAAMGMLYRLGLGETRLLVVGSGRLGKMIMQHIVANPNLGYSIVGFLHDMNEPPSDFGRFKVLGTLEDLGMVIRSMQIDEVIIALPSYLHQQSIRTVRMCERLGTSFKLVPDLYELSLSRIDMEAIEGIPLLSIKQVSINSVQRIVTRVVDIIGATIILIIGLPLWLCIALAVWISSAGPGLYKQTRIGLNGRPFKVYKFRSMDQ